MAVKDKVVVRLTDDPRAELGRVVRTGTHPAGEVRRANIPLLADTGGADGLTDEEIADRLGVNGTTVARTRQRFVCDGLSGVRRKPPTGRQYRKRGGAQEATLVALTCSPAPGGRARWTMTLLADKLVELQVVGGIDPTTVWRSLKKTPSSRG